MSSAQKPYNDYANWVGRHFACKIQKISVDAGFSCPNRDGSKGKGGCIFCDNRTFNPAYCTPQKTVTEQLNDGKDFFARKYPDMKYLAYFQAFTNTYAPLHHLKALYEEALAVDDIMGIVIGTRPDCISNELLDYLALLNTQTMVVMEYGIESTNDSTLKFINRGHNIECARKAIMDTAERGITTCAHLILGLPGEDRADILTQADIISELPIDILKLHQMQVIKGTRLADLYHRNPFHIFDIDEYIKLVTEYVMRLRPDITIERFASQSPADMLIAPRWGLKNHELTNLIVNHMVSHGYKQGDKYQTR